MPRRSDLQEIVQQFVDKLSSMIETEVVSRAREAALTALDGRGSVIVRGAGVIRKRRKGPIQLCPVPGCQNRAAPVFGMVCAKHKDLPKAEIKKYREARRAQRKGGKAPARARRRSTPKATPKAAAPKAA